MGWFTGLVWLCWGVLLTTRANSQAGKSNVPRLKLSYKEMLESNSLITFSGLANSSNYHTFLVDEERRRLYVGAKDHIFSLNLDNVKDFQKIVWPASYSRRNECRWTGKDIMKECANYVTVLKAYNQTHLYACGTGAFHPICTYVEIGHHPEDNIFKLSGSHFENGRGKSPYDPKLQTSSLLIGGQLYAGTASDFMGRDFAIFRTLGHQHTMRTEQHDSRWLNEPSFISAHLIPESDNPEDDKIYFFFRENALDRGNSGKATRARISQICKNDLGGYRSLVNKWTTFLKARLICSVPGPNGIDTHFNELQDVFLMNSKQAKSPIVYGVFTTSSNIFKGSAICMYSMSDVRRVFLGPYAHRDGPHYQWVPYQGRVPYPRPGTCPSKTFGGFDSTKDLPDDVITFARSHPAMYNPVLPVNNHPIMIKTDVNYQFTQIVVDRVDAEDGQYDVMFIGTDIGTVLKVVTIPKENWHDVEEVWLEEMRVFREPIAISAMELSTKQAMSLSTYDSKAEDPCPKAVGDIAIHIFELTIDMTDNTSGKGTSFPRTKPPKQQLYVGSVSAVSQLPLHRCDIYGKACADCCLARDPYCAWDGSSCSRYFPSTKKRTRRQDVRNGDPLTPCSDLKHYDKHHSHSLEERIIYGVENSSTFLECSPKSQQAVVYWQFQGLNEEDGTEEIKVDDHIIRTEQGLLLRSLQQKDSGNYLCHSVEHGFVQTLLKVTLVVIDEEHLKELLQRYDDDGSKTKEMPVMTPSQKAWYRDLIQLLNHPNLNTMDEFCEQVWKRDRKPRRQRLGHSQGNTNKWKHLQENKKGRNRRTHEYERAPRSV